MSSRNTSDRRSVSSICCRGLGDFITSVKALKRRQTGFLPMRSGDLGVSRSEARSAFFRIASTMTSARSKTFKGFAVDAGLVYRFQYGSARRAGAESGSREE